MFKKILIANRGEIAVRIIRTCKRLEIQTVAIYSEVDARSLHVQEADEAVLVGKARSAESYLVAEKIIDAAIKTGCQAIHPGYGFLSENALFCEKVCQSGLVFIGPPAAAIATLGDKIASKALALKSGVPVVPGHIGMLSGLKEAEAIAEQIGYPVLLKPAAGGGGKGMRIVSGKKEMGPAFSACQEETRKAFGDPHLFIERYIANPRHIEIQILADQYGNVIHLGERECSIQRRYQKIIEETPSPAVDPALRLKMGRMACSLAREAGYTNAGTVEFIMDEDRNMYFLEMNTRLQVEHPVTELVTGLDMVELQLKIACGEELSIRQEDVSFNGSAIEARICAEDPSRNFMPATGMITRYASPRGRSIRVDSGIVAGSVVSVYYDSLLSKVISWGETRESARMALINALNGYHIEGVITNVDFVNLILNHPAFTAGELSTRFIEQHFDNEKTKIPPPTERIVLMAIATTLVYHNRQKLIRDSLKPMAAHVGGLEKPRSWYHYMVKGEADIVELRLQENPDLRTWTILADGNQYQVITPELEYYRRRIKLNINGQSQMFRLQFRGNFFRAAFCGINRIFEVYSPREWELAQFMPKVQKRILDNVLECPMPGLVVDIRVQKGDRVYRGQELVIVESMKMESGVASPCDGEVLEILIEKGQAVDTGNILMRFKH
ncbi:MAG: acetyl/propionyl-CoA carboxylase subuit alpha [Desulfobacteraceae bacterium A6]|nr:MAG: acetyl/propionyl-CoA carboxylase subuit alpha [Desulfobacteraceae bacterium A6]